MKTITRELKELAMACVNVDEYSERAKLLLKSKSEQPIMTDREMRDIYRKVDRERNEEKAWEKLDNTIRPMLGKRTDCSDLWYEVWIDLDDSWLEKWFSAFQFMKDKEIVEACAKYLNERERFYNSSSYIDRLNDLADAYYKLQEEEK